jgi:hypothetical protein
MRMTPKISVSPMAIMRMTPKISVSPMAIRAYIRPRFTPVRVI